MIRAALSLIGLALLASQTAMAEGRRMLGVHEQPEWSAVGRLNMGGTTCTAAMIAPDMIITAAHCVFVVETGARRLPEKMRFVAGYRLRKHSGTRRAENLTVHPDFSLDSDDHAVTIGSDLAMVRLESSLTEPMPFGMARAPSPGDQVAVLSYRKDRPEIVSIEEPCNVVATDPQIAVLDCEAVSGASGSPVFIKVDDVWRIVAVISSIGDFKGEPHSFAVILDNAMHRLRAAH